MPAVRLLPWLPECIRVFVHLLLSRLLSSILLAPWTCLSELCYYLSYYTTLAKCYHDIVVVLSAPPPCVPRALGS